MMLSRRYCMRTILIIAVLLLTAAAVAADSSDGFVPLFNGKDLTGWVVTGDPAGFTVVDGCLMSEGGKGGNMILTARPYANYIFRTEWMLSKTGNSGLMVRGGTPGGGFEVQLLAPWTPYRDDLHCTGSMYGYVPANPRPDETTLRWRKAEIRAEYKHVEAYIDGVRTSAADYDKVPGMERMALSGYVGMQDSHTGPGEWVRFRNIEIKDLDQDPNFVARGLASKDAQVRRSAYSAAIKLGGPMIDVLLDMLARGGSSECHTAELALNRIVGELSAPVRAAQAAQARTALLARLGRAGTNADKDRVAAAKLLGLIGTNDRATTSALHKAAMAGGLLRDAALSSLEMLSGR